MPAGVRFVGKGDIEAFVLRRQSLAVLAWCRATEGKTMMVRNGCVVAVLIGSAASSHAEQSINVVGTWKLESARAVTATGGDLALPFGVSPTGAITYTGDGRMSVLISHGRRKLLSADRIAAPMTEKAEAFATFFAYAGTYTLRGDQITHHVEISSVPNWVGTDLVRTAKFSGDTLTLTTPPTSVRGAQQTTELHWKRVR